jgi:DNA primase
VATCGTALTEEHVRLLKRFANKVVLAFDADNAGQGAAERFYEWESRYKVQVSVAKFPDGKDPGDLASSDPEALATAIKNAQPFLGFRLQRVLNAGSIATPEARSRTAEQAMAVINEHPDMNVRKIYAGEVASHVGIAAADLVKVAERGSRRPEVRAAVPSQSGHKRESAEFVVLALMIQDWNAIASWMNEALFADDVYRRAFLALIATEGELNAALEAADPEAREALERAAVADVESQPDAEAFNLISAAVRRELSHRVKNIDPEQIRVDRDARLLLEQMENPATSHDAAEQLLGWLKMCMGEHS